jgi:radical SAM superfamily enzyme YgiQ (UPF0313 family)
MKILFIYPRFEKLLEAYALRQRMPAAAGTWSFRMPPAQAIPILVELLPAGTSWRVIDQNSEAVDFDDDADLVAVSFFTPQATDAYELADRFLSRGKTVVMGGLHPTVCPGEAARHCTSLCIGEAEDVWPAMLADFRQGRLKRLYRPATPIPGERIAAGAMSLRAGRAGYDWSPALVAATRGCPYGCTWCSLPQCQGGAVRFRPMERVAAQIASLGGREFYLIDDVLLLDRPETRDYLSGLCRMLAGSRSPMLLASSPAFDPSPDLLDLLASAGAREFYIAFADDPASRRFFARDRELRRRWLGICARLADRNVRLFASFGLGFDGAGAGQFDTVLEFCRQARPSRAEFFIATPFPGTPFWRAVVEADRLLGVPVWRRFNGAHAVFAPQDLTPQALEEGFLRLWEDYYGAAPGAAGS